MLHHFAETPAYHSQAIVCTKLLIHRSGVIKPKNISINPSNETVILIKTKVSKTHGAGWRATKVKANIHHK